jgi:hypothetical protein
MLKTFNEVYSLIFLILENDNNVITSDFISTAFKSVFDIDDFDSATIKLQIEKYECLYNFKLEKLKEQISKLKSTVRLNTNIVPPLHKCLSCYTMLKTLTGHKKCVTYTLSGCQENIHSSYQCNCNAIYKHNTFEVTKSFNF